MQNCFDPPKLASSTEYDKSLDIILKLEESELGMSLYSGLPRIIRQPVVARISQRSDLAVG